LLVRRKGQSRNFSKRDFQQGEISRQFRYFECNKPSHIKSECPLLKKDFKRGNPKKKAVMVTWDDTDSSSFGRDKENDAYLCLMENSNKEELFVS